MPNQSITNNTPKNESFQEKLAFYQLEKQSKIRDEIINAKEPEYLLDLPIVLAEKNGVAILNMVLSDAGMGKSLFTRILLSDVVENDDVVVLYFDLEYIATVSKERNFQKLFDNNNFILIRYSDVDEIRQKTRLNTTATIVNNLIEGFKMRYPDKKIVAIIDSFEDYIEDTANDTELKRVLYKALSIKGVTYIINHHITKDEMKSNSMRFRGSMIIKAKVTSMIYLTERHKENDFEELFEFEILKIRTAYKPTRKLSVRVNLNELRIKDVIISSNNEEIYILKTAYFILKKEKKLQKTELIKLIAQKVNKNIDKVRNVIDKNIEFFNVEKGEKRTEYYSLNTNADKLDKLLALLGINNNFSEQKQTLFDMCKALQLNNIEQIAEIKTNSSSPIHIYTSLSSILNNVYKLSDSEADEILESLSLQFADA